MKKERIYLIAVDLEGIHGVVGEPNETLTKSKDYAVATRGAVSEINTVLRALFEGGADRVIVWDNHGKGNNFSPDALLSFDGRVEYTSPVTPHARMTTFRDRGISGMIYLGYHAREGAFGGVLAHTYSSIAIQYYKLGGRAVGEIGVDARLAADLGIPSILVASDDVCCREAAKEVPGITTVITKYGKGRNRAVLRPEDEVLHELYEATLLAMKNPPALPDMPFPTTLEARYTRVERAAEQIERLSSLGIPTRYGEDAHIVISELRSIDDLLLFM
jgi:D-amino peptidase